MILIENPGNVPMDIYTGVSKVFRDFPWGDEEVHRVFENDAMAWTSKQYHRVYLSIDEGRRLVLSFAGGTPQCSKFIDAMATIVAHFGEGKIPYRFAWHTLASLLYAEGLNPNTGLPFKGDCPPIGLPDFHEMTADVDTKRPTISELDAILSAEAIHQPSAGILPVPSETFPNWSQGDLKAERAKRQKALQEVESQARELKGLVMSVDRHIKK